MTIERAQTEMSEALESFLLYVRTDLQEALESLATAERYAEGYVNKAHIAQTRKAIEDAQASLRWVLP